VIVFRTEAKALLASARPVATQMTVEGFQTLTTSDLASDSATRMKGKAIAPAAFETSVRQLTT
jgi:hypothetical protein